MGLAKRLPRDFFRQSAVELAPQLIGKVLGIAGPQGPISGRIVETEAYPGYPDEASHSARGSTPRCEVMFRAGGVAYVYFTYGCHHCVNVVCDAEGIGAAVLIRALEPLTGIAEMQKRRGKTKLTELCSGPGKLCQALGLNLIHNGFDLRSSELFITSGSKASSLASSPRIGISKNKEVAWRFYEKDSPYLSQKNMTVKVKK